MRQENFFRTGWLNILFQALFLAFLYVLETFSPLRIEGTWKTATTWFLVLLPSAIWAWFFYLQDRQAPEPSRYIIASFLAGLGGASVFALPLERDLFQTGEWLYESPVFLLLGSALIRGTLMSFLVYLLIGYGFYPSREFEEPTDGMIYGALAGSGFAAITSLSYVAGHPDFTLFASGYTAATNVLMYASTGSLVGHLVGRTKFFPEHSQRSHVLAILTGALLIGLYHVANEFVLLAGWHQAFWLSFGVTVVLSAAVLVLATALMRKLALAPAAGVTGRPIGALVVWGLAVLLLLGAGFVRHLATRTVTHQSQRYGLAFEYPPTRLKPTLSTTASSDPVLLPSIFTARGFDRGPVIFSVAAKKESVEPSALDPLTYLRVSPPLSIALEQVAVAGQKAIRAKYSYLKRSTFSADDFPEIAWVYTDIVPSKNYTYVFTLEGTPSNFREQEKLYQRILDSVKWTTDSGKERSP